MAEIEPEHSRQHKGLHPAANCMVADRF
jgi:hypothetical protein